MKSPLLATILIGSASLFLGGCCTTCPDDPAAPLAGEVVITQSPDVDCRWNREVGAQQISIEVSGAKNYSYKINNLELGENNGYTVKVPGSGSFGISLTVKEDTTDYTCCDFPASPTSKPVWAGTETFRFRGIAGSQYAVPIAFTACEE